MHVGQRLDHDPSSECDHALPHRRRALLVEDGLINRQIAKALLERGDFDVSIAENGAEALEAVHLNEAFDIVLMDLDMPVMDGFEAAAAIRRIGDGRGAVPIVALTALAQGSEVARARSAGMDGHLAKPFDPGTFALDVERWIEAPVARTQGGRDHVRPAVWNRQTFDDIATRLGSVRIGQALLLFEARLTRTLAALSAPDVTATQVAFEAHALVSGAGTLGFEELCALSNDLQRHAITAEAGPCGAASAMAASVAEILGAIERALALVSRAQAEAPAGAERGLALGPLSRVERAGARERDGGRRGGEGGMPGAPSRT